MMPKGPDTSSNREELELKEEEVAQSKEEMKEEKLEKARNVTRAAVSRLFYYETS